ncbi:hypothetical protein AABB24_032666 [Solanum stoloniferum]|uniref:Uncharacterized protein n=1 Tax=Solanum stoloniferum TaxID=62892 RepID=A0ABD2RK10_9SOLN
MVKILEVRFWRLQRLTSSVVSLYPLGLFGSCTAIWIYWSGLQQKRVSKCCLNLISCDFLVGVGFVNFGLDCTLLFVLAAIGSYRAVNYSFHGAALFVHIC